jgi:predicted TIM-barrel fold metal-dependent hydrolase
MTVIDCHCHLGIGHDYEQTAESLLADMDRCGVEQAVICPVDRYIAVHNRAGNDAVLAAADAHPDRFIPFATANPWYGDEACDELRRALDAGARGLKFHPALQGFLLCDELIDPLIEIARQRRVLVYMHTGTPAYAQPTQLTELALRFPDVSFVMGHMGSTDFWLDAVPAASVSENIYVDTSWSLPQKIERALAALGSERVLFGTDTPLSTLDLELACLAHASMSDSARENVMGGNLRRLLESAA